MSSLIGQQLGNYEIISFLDKGGMATVYRARQVNIKREVAIKVIQPDLEDTDDFARRFEREAETIASLRHPHILKLFDYGQQGDLIFLVMELMEGGSLARLIRKGPLSLDTAGRLLDQVCSALDYAHGRDIVHRDLKPQNVLLDEQGNAFLTDFGIARLLHQTTQLTQSGVLMGTPAYMSPEQWQGKSHLDARTDVYGLGIMLFEMLAGQLPYAADTPYSMMHMHVNEPPPPIDALRPDLPPVVALVIERALAKNREDRFQTAGGMAQAFRGALAGQTIPFIPPPSKPGSGGGVTPSPFTRPVPQGVGVTQPTFRPRRSLLMGIGAITLVIALIAGSLGVMLSNRTEATATVTPSNAVIILPTIQMITATSAVPPTLTTLPQSTLLVAIAPTTKDVPQSTASPTITPNQEQTIHAIVNMTLTAAVPSATQSPSQPPRPPNTASSTLTATVTPTITATAASISMASFTATPTSTLSLTLVPCTVMTDKANIVAIRVGPGKNRGLRDYMPANKPYQVIGQAQASDGSAWWKLKTDDSSDAWVAQADVSASGDCGRVEVVPTPSLPAVAPASACKIAQFSIDNPIISGGTQTVIHWVVQGSVSQAINGKSVAASGQMAVGVAGIYTLTVTCSGGKTLTSSVSLQVISPAGGAPDCVPINGYCEVNGAMTGTCCTGTCTKIAPNTATCQ